MGVVCNSTVLIALSRIGHLWILEQLFGNILIPPAVYNDVVIKGARKPGAKDVAEAKWIHVQTVGDKEQVLYLSSILHQGEAEAIVLAEEIDAELISILEYTLSVGYAKNHLLFYLASNSFASNA